MLTSFMVAVLICRLPPSGSVFHFLCAEFTPGGAHFVSGMCSSTIATRLPDGFNRINELVRVCVLNIFQFPELYYRHFIATEVARRLGVLTF